MKLSTVFVILVGVVVLQAAATPGCTTDMDCSLNGECSTGSCVCDSAWMGSTCNEMAIVPASVNQVPIYGVTPNVTSWGGNVIRDDNGLYHLFVSEMANGCGLDTWGKNSFITHATSTTPMGPYKKHDVALPVWSHNASPLRAPAAFGNGTRPWFIFHIGTGTGGSPEVCNNNTGSQFSHPSFRSKRKQQPDASSSLLHTAPTPDGPWTPLGSIGCNNPAPFFNKNGSFYVGCGEGSHVAVHKSPDGGLTWNSIANINFPATWSALPYIETEDPFLYMDARGHYHLLVHRYDYRNGFPVNPNATASVLVSAHAYSKDMFNWEFADPQPYNNWRDHTDGPRRYFATMERPHLVFNDDQSISHLIVAASPIWGNPPCAVCDARPGSEHSCVVCKTSKGFDYDFTLMAELNNAKVHNSY